MMDISDTLARCFARIQFMAERLALMIQIHYVEPDASPAYQKYRFLQDQLEGQYRRLLSVQGRLAAQEQKASETGADTLQQKQAEIDKLKADLSAVKNMTVAAVRKLYE